MYRTKLMSLRTDHWGTLNWRTDGRDLESSSLATARASPSDEETDFQL